MKFKIGDRVVYVSGDWGCSRNDPLLGTEFECVGSIKKVAGRECDVLWDNGVLNFYYDKDLSLKLKFPEWEV